MPDRTTTTIAEALQRGYLGSVADETPDSTYAFPHPGEPTGGAPKAEPSVDPAAAPRAGKG